MLTYLEFRMERLWSTDVVDSLNLLSETGILLALTASDEIKSIETTDFAVFDRT